MMIFDRLPRFTRDERFLVPLGAIAFAIVFCWPLLGNLSTPGTMMDWDLSLEFLWVACRTILKYHQLPLWNPYKCGGMPMFANLQAHISMPFFLLPLIFGPFLGAHLEVIVRLAVAWAGGYVLGRVLKIRPLGALTVATVFAASSWFYLKIAAGHLMALEFTWAPWAFAAAWMAADRYAFRYAALAGAVLALIFLGNGPNPLMVTAVAIAAVLLGDACVRQSPKPVWILGAVALFTVGFSMVRLVPAFLLSLQYPRPTADIEVDNPPVLLIAMFSRRQELFRGLPNGWGFWEGGAYIGIFALPAALGVMRPRRAAPWIIAGTLLILLARGDAEPFSVWPAVHKLPLVSSLRLPSRFLVAFTLVVGVMAGFGIDWLSARWRPWSALIAAAIIVIAAVDCLLVGPPSLDTLLQYPANPRPAAAVFHQIRHGSGNGNMLVSAMENTGVVDCYDYTQWNTNVAGAGDPGYRGEQYLAGPGAINLAQWSPNAITYDVDVPSASEIIVNQNYSRWWRVAAGQGVAVDHDGLIGVRIPAGRQHLKLAYRDYSMLVGALASIATLAIALGIARRESRPTC